MRHGPRVAVAGQRNALLGGVGSHVDSGCLDVDIFRCGALYSERIDNENGPPVVNVVIVASRKQWTPKN